MLTTAYQPEGLIALAVMALLTLAGIGISHLLGLQRKAAGGPPLGFVAIFFLYIAVLHVCDRLSRRGGDS
jgi:hypothetical protein